MPKVVDPMIRRKDIVAATSALLASSGPEALSLRKIAEKAGCTIGLINHWFSSKDDLIEAVLDDAANAAIERCKKVLNNPDVTLEQVVCEFLPLDKNRTSELRVWLVFWGLSIARPALRRGYKQRVAGMREQLSDEIQHRAIVTKDVVQFVDVLMASLDGIAVNALADPDYWTATRQRETLRWLLQRIT